MSGNEANPRPKTGNWRPFRPAGMSDGAWTTMFLIHRYPEEWMPEEEQRHCLGPQLFGKGGPRFGDYGRGWIQEMADERVRQGKTPYAIDAREWRPEVVEAIDYYNDMTFEQGVEEGIVASDAEFFRSSIPFPRGTDCNTIFAQMDEAVSRIDQIWYSVCYGPYGSGPWHLLTKGVLNGWQDSFECAPCAGFSGIRGYDWRCAALGESVKNMLAMSEMCPISANASLFGGIDLALDFAKEGGLSANERSRTVKFVKRAFRELYKRGEAAVKELSAKYDISEFFLEIRKREREAMVVFDGETRCSLDEMDARSQLFAKAIKREPLVDQNRSYPAIDAIMAKYNAALAAGANVWDDSE